jgi:hypothetical protein
MPVADWTFYNSGMSGAQIEVPAPTITYPALGVFDPFDFTDAISGRPRDFAINNSKALVMAQEAGVGTLLAGYAALTDNQPHGFTQGRAVNNVRMHPIYNFPMHLGICVLQSQEDMSPEAGGKGYALIADTILSQNRFKLVQLNDGVSGSPGGALGTSYTLLDQTDDGAFSPGEIITMDLRFFSDPDVLKGVWLQAWVSRTSATMPVKLFEIVHAGGIAHVPETSEGEGVLMFSSTNTTIGYFDNLKLYGPDEV